MKTWRILALICVLVAWLALPGTTSSVRAASPTVPAAPHNVHASLGSVAGSATVTWVAPNDGGLPILAYRIAAYHETDADTAATAFVYPPASSATLVGLLPATTYRFTVSALNVLGWNAEPAVSNEITLPAFPEAPTGVQVVAAATPRSAIVSWKAPKSASAILGYMLRVYVGPDGSPVLTRYAVAVATSFTLSNLDPGATYVFTVTARNHAGWGVESARSAPLAMPPVVPSVPWTPTNVRAVAGPETGSATVTWNAPYSGGSPILGYDVRAYLSSGTVVAATGYAYPPATSVTLHGLVGGQAYTFTVAAENVVGSGLESARSTLLVLPPLSPTVPGAPTSVSATAGSTPGTVFLSWSTPDNGGSSITGYTVLAYLGSDSTPAATLSVGAGISGTTMTGLTGGTYRFAVKAGNIYGWGMESARSAAVTIVNVPGTPLNVHAAAGPTSSSATVTWAAPMDGGSAITGYMVLAYAGSISTPFATVAVGSLATNATFAGLSTNVKYTFTVKASNLAGWGLESARSEIVTLATAPWTPTNVTAVTGINSVTVSWYAPASDGGKPITGYIVTASTGNAWESVMITAPASASSATLAQLVPGRTYTITVAAFNTIGTGAQSTPTLPVTLPSAPGVPGNLSVIAGGSTLQVTWAAPANNGGKPITGYTVVVSDGVHAPAMQQVTGTAAEFPGLATGVTYTVSVTASNIVGTSTAASKIATLPNLPPTLDIQAEPPIHHGDLMSFMVTTTNAEPADHIILSATGLPNGVSFTDFGNGSGKVSGHAEVAAGTYAVTFSANDGHNPSVSKTVDLTIVRETAVVTPNTSNLTSIAINASSRVSGALTLRATLHEAYDPDGMADIGEAAPVTYTLSPLGGGQPYTFVANSNGGGIGGELNTSAVFKRLPANVYRVTVSVGGNFYHGSADTFLTVYNPAVRPTVKGEGSVTLNGDQGYFQFNTAYGRNGKLTGKLLFMRQAIMRDIALPDSQATSIGSQLLQGSVSGGIVVKGHRAYFQGTAKLNGTAGYRFVVSIQDNRYGKAKDQFGLQVVDPQHAPVSILSFALVPVSEGHATFKK